MSEFLWDVFFITVAVICAVIALAAFRFAWWLIWLSPRDVRKLKEKCDDQ